jgi:hypothetical protein
MFEALARSWNLAKESMRVLRQDPELILFPVISFIAGVVIAGVLGGTGFATGGFSDGGVTGLGIFYVLLFYLATYFVTIYFQVALVASVKLRLSGGNPNLGYGVREARKKLGPIIAWTVLAAAVGLLLRLLEEAARHNTSGWGRIAAGLIIGLIGVAWSLATFFVIPVIVYEGLGGFDALKRSAAVIKQRWGEAVVGQAGITLVMWLLALLIGAVLLIPGIIALNAGGGAGLAIGVLFIAAAVVSVLFIIALATALQSVYTTVLYQYVTTGQTSEVFSRSMLDSAFRPGPAFGT